jgi:hypothetical protein
MWEKVENPDRYLARLNLREYHECRGARKQALPFYTAGYLIQVFLERGVCIGVASESDVVWLDGNSRTVYEANRVMGLSLDETNAAQYMRFFCDHIAAEQGSFDVQTVIDMKRNEAGDYVFQCVMGYGEHRFLTEMRVGQDGGVEMLEDEFIGGLH